LVNKIKANNLQDQGLDTIDANLALGMSVYNRSFQAASEIVKNFNMKSIRLLSNNPNKKTEMKN
jgi:GTP cyclohydrolase II